MIPLRVDFAGGWLDVPKFARPGAYIVNCAIEEFDSRPGGGLGGSAWDAIRSGIDPLMRELEIVGWQDAAALLETGLCVWRSGPAPVLESKHNPDFLRGKMALLWTGKPHDTYAALEKQRPLGAIQRAAEAAFAASKSRIHRLDGLTYAVGLSYAAQLAEDMEPLPYPKLARKYCGSGWGGYALYMFGDETERATWLAEAGDAWEVTAIEPYMRGYGDES